jgi:hypothetical protein
MSHPAGKLSDSLHFLSLPKSLFRSIGINPMSNVANVALNYIPSIHSIDIAHNLYADRHFVFGQEGQALIAHIPLVNQFAESSLAGIDVLRQAQVPERLSAQLSLAITQKFRQIRIRIRDQSGLRVEDQYPIL